MLIGRIKSVPEVKKSNRGNTLATLIVDVDRNFKNPDGTLTTDTFCVTVWKGAAEEAQVMAEVGGLVVIKGRMNGKTYESEDGKTFYNVEIVAEKIDYLTKPKKNKKE